MSDLAIETQKLTKTYKHVDVVHDVSLAVPRGAIYCLLGRNGSGKTTTIRMLLGLAHPKKLRLWITGMQVNQFPILVAVSEQSTHNVTTAVTTPSLFIVNRYEIMRVGIVALTWSGGPERGVTGRSNFRATRGVRKCRSLHYATLRSR